MSKKRQPPYFDFIHQHEERLNLIYSRWEAQIAKQSASNQSKSLVEKVKSHKKVALAGMAIAFGSAFLACQHAKVNATKTLIANNSLKLELMSWELQHTAKDSTRSSCVKEDGNIYQLSSSSLSHRALANEPRSFLTQPDTISIVRHSFDTQQPDAYLRLNRDRNLLYGSIEQTGDTMQTTTQVIDLDPDMADLSGDKEAINSYTQVQENAIALHEELSQCLSKLDAHDTVIPFPHFPYAD